MTAPFPCLILTPWMALHQVRPWQKAISMEYTGEIYVLERYEEEAHSPSVSIRFPAVGQLVKQIARDKHDVKYSRSNLYARDHHTCQYCGVKFPEKQLTYDHVIPRVRGGKTVWENIVAACKPCNARKGARTPAQAGLRLLNKPIRPKSLPMRPAMIALPREVPEPWLPYLTDKMAKIAQWAAG
jgi:5-methylcytosine-specific restriction endonuclease McrA